MAGASGIAVIGGVKPFELPDCPDNAECIGPELEQLTDGAIYDPEKESWTNIAAAPAPLHRADALTWTGSEFVAFGAAYDPLADRWRSLPTPNFLTYDGLSWTGTEVVTTSWDYDKGQRNGVGQFVGASLAPGNGQWRLSAWPHEPPGMESTRSVAVGEAVVALVTDDNCTEHNPYCARVVEWSPASNVWRDIAELPSTGHVGSVGDGVVVALPDGEVRLVRLSPPSVESLPSPQVGVARQLAADGTNAAILGLGSVAVLEADRSAWVRHPLPEATADSQDLKMLWLNEELFLWRGATAKGGAASLWRLVQDQ